MNADCVPSKVGFKFKGDGHVANLLDGSVPSVPLVERNDRCVLIPLT